MRARASAQQELESHVPTDEVYQALVGGFEKALKIQLVKEELTSYERKLAEKIRRNKFSTDDWNFNGKAVV